MKRILLMTICSFLVIVSFAQKSTRVTSDNPPLTSPSNQAITKEIADSCYKQASFYYAINDFPNCYQNLLIYYQYNQATFAAYPDDLVVQQVLHMMRYSQEEIRKGTPINKDMLDPNWRGTRPRGYMSWEEDSVSKKTWQSSGRGGHYINPATWSQDEH